MPYKDPKPLTSSPMYNTYKQIYLLIRIRHTYLPTNKGAPLTYPKYTYITQIEENTLKTKHRKIAKTTTLGTGRETLSIHPRTRLSCHNHTMINPSNPHMTKGSYNATIDKELEGPIHIRPHTKTRRYTRDGDLY